MDRRMRVPTEVMLKLASPTTARALERSLEGNDLVEEQIVNLFSVTGTDFFALVMAADFLRHETVGGEVTYVVNRNINFTNVCVKHCSFCAFSRTYRSNEGYYLPMEEIVRRAREAQEYGATEICIQAGLPPDMEGDFYIRLCTAVKEALPDLHIHAFSPEEILYGSQRSGMSITDYLRELKDAGIGSLPGTSAEILDDDIRRRISPGRISTAQWIEVITTAHALGIPTSCTAMWKQSVTLRDICSCCVTSRGAAVALPNLCRSVSSTRRHLSTRTAESKECVLAPPEWRSSRCTPLHDSS
jgi:2-iminoacetate synthase ThiH